MAEEFDIRVSVEIDRSSLSNAISAAASQIDNFVNSANEMMSTVGSSLNISQNMSNGLTMALGDVESFADLANEQIATIGDNVQIDIPTPDIGGRQQASAASVPSGGAASLLIDSATLGTQIAQLILLRNVFKDLGKVSESIGTSFNSFGVIVSKVSRLMRRFSRVATENFPDIRHEARAVRTSFDEINRTAQEASRDASSAFNNLGRSLQRLGNHTENTNTQLRETGDATEQSGQQAENTGNIFTRMATRGRSAFRAMLDAARSAFRAFRALPPQLQAIIVVVAAATAVIAAFVAGVLAVTVVVTKLALSQREAFKELDRWALKLGETLNTMQAYRKLSLLSGLETDNFAEAIKNVSESVSEANSSLKGAKFEAFAKLNLDIKELKSLNPTEQFRLVRAALDEVKDSADKIRLSEELGGEDLFKTGAVENFQDKLKEISKTMFQFTEEGRKGIRGMEEQFGGVGGAFEDTKNFLLQELAPVLAGLAESVKDFLQEFRETGALETLVSIAKGFFIAIEAFVTTQGSQLITFIKVMNDTFGGSIGIIKFVSRAFVILNTTIITLVQNFVLLLIPGIGFIIAALNTLRAALNMKKQLVKLEADFVDFEEAALKSSNKVTTGFETEAGKRADLIKKQTAFAISEAKKVGEALTLTGTGLSKFLAKEFKISFKVDDEKITDILGREISVGLKLKIDTKLLDNTIKSVFNSIQELQNNIGKGEDTFDLIQSKQALLEQLEALRDMVPGALETAKAFKAIEKATKEAGEEFKSSFSSIKTTTSDIKENLKRINETTTTAKFGLNILDQLLEQRDQLKDSGKDISSINEDIANVERNLQIKRLNQLKDFRNNRLDLQKNAEKELIASVKKTSLALQNAKISGDKFGIKILKKQINEQSKSLQDLFNNRIKESKKGGDDIRKNEDDQLKVIVKRIKARQKIEEDALKKRIDNMRKESQLLLSFRNEAVFADTFEATAIAENEGRGVGAGVNATAIEQNELIRKRIESDELLKAKQDALIKSNNELKTNQNSLVRATNGLADSINAVSTKQFLLKF